MQNRMASKLVELRNKRGLSQKQLAKKLGLSEGFIKDVELGRKILNENIIAKISKLFNEDLDSGFISAEDEAEELRKHVETPEKALSKAKDVWTNAFSSVIKKVPIYDYNMNKPLGSIDMPIVSNKVDGHNPDKVMFLKIEDDSMLGMRINEGDLAFSIINSNIENNGIYFLQHGEERVVRQVKLLDSNKVLLISQRGTLRTETVSKKNIKILARLLWFRINL